MQRQIRKEEKDLIAYLLDELVDFLDWEEKLGGKYDSVLRIHDVVELEQIIKRENHSKVKSVYN